MKPLQRALLSGFERLEAGLDRIFTPAWDPMYYLGALGFYMFWIVAVSGIYLYILFDTSVIGAYGSVEALTREQWYLGGVMRSLHRYASDGLVLVMMVHLVREYALDRLRGPRWFTWLTGVPILWLVILSGITGYLLVWDELAQYVAIATAEFLDWLPIFADPVARNFLMPASIDDRFFTLLVFLHIFVPLFLLFVLWIHLQRVSRPGINPPRGLAIGTMVMLLALSFYKPAVSHGPANLAKVPGEIELDWFYLAFYPLFDQWPAAILWGLFTGGSLLLMILPWLPPGRRAKRAEVHLDRCNGCTRCAEDCPYAAIVMRPRTDGRAFAREAAVKPKLCVACGICVGSCPAATPFRRTGEMTTGIDLPDKSLARLRTDMAKASARLKTETRVLVFGCDHGAALKHVEGPGVAALTLPCIGQLPPAFIDYALSRGLAEGVFVTGCCDGNCRHRFGNLWTEQRIRGERDPRLRRRVPRERVAVAWAGPADWRRLAGEVEAFAARVKDMGPVEPAPRPKAGPPPDPREERRRLARTTSPAGPESPNE